MNIFNIRYAALNFSYDKDLVKQEIFQHKFIDIPATKEFLALRPFDLVDPCLYEKVPTLTPQGIIAGEIPSWKGYSFTEIPGDSFSSFGGNLSRLKTDKWVWKKDSNAPYIKELINQLGFEQVQNVRVMMIDPPGFGPVHNDLPPSSNYFENHVSVTLNISDGGQPLVAMLDNKLIELGKDDAFIFRDDCWHGVRQVSSQRIQLRINGIVNQETLSKFIKDEIL